jgi:hypothetical protein
MYSFPSMLQRHIGVVFLRAFRLHDFINSHPIAIIKMKSHEVWSPDAGLDFIVNLHPKVYIYMQNTM